MSIADILAAKNAESQSNLRTGAQNSAETASTPQTPQYPHPDDPLIGAIPAPSALREVSSEDQLEFPVGPPGSYRSLSLKRFTIGTGQWIYPNAEGFFIPETQEQLDNLEHFANQWNMVELQVGE